MKYPAINQYKYRNQASSFSSMINSVNGELNTALTELDSIESTIGYNEKANDLLTSNVLASNEEIKSEIKGVLFNLTHYDSLVAAKAKELDEEEIREAYQRYLKEKEKEELENN